MVAINPLNVITLLTAIFSEYHFQQSSINEAEKALANSLSSVIFEVMSDSVFETYEETSLDFSSYADTPIAYSIDTSLMEIDDSGEDDDSEDEYDDEDDLNISDPSSSSRCSKSAKDISPEYKRKAVEYWKNENKGLRPLSSVQSRYRQVKSDRQLRRWAQQLQLNKFRQWKLHQISEFVLQKFVNARQKNMIIHDSTLRLWGIEAARKVQWSEFQASPSWLLRFKRKHNIVSRKVTKFITHKRLAEERNILHAAEAFVEKSKPLILNYGAANTWNCDESGFTLEIHSGRSLTFQGEKRTEGIVQSTSAITHSYTILPAISADGKLFVQLLVVLREPKGELGPRVQASMFKPFNIFVQVSKSGKLTKDLFQKWMTEIFLPKTGTRTLLFLDKWKGHCHKTLAALAPKDKDLRVEAIPEGSTSLIQPLDVYFFRMWKRFVRQLSDLILLLEEDVNLQARDTILKIQSITHNQFSSPRFTEMIKYSWYKIGYVELQPVSFTTPADFCFNDQSTERRCHICGKIAIFRCSWCKKSFCFEHFFTEYHYCNHYEP